MHFMRIVHVYVSACKCDVSKNVEKQIDDIEICIKGRRRVSDVPYRHPAGSQDPIR